MLIRQINAVALDDLDALLAGLDEQGFAVIRFDGAAVVDKASFLARAESDLPHPDELHPNNWDSLADALWNGLADDPHDQLAIAWTHAERFVEADLGDFLTAVDVITTTARQVSKPVVLCLLGEGSGYRRYAPD